MKTKIYAPFWIVERRCPTSARHRRNDIRAGLRSVARPLLRANQSGDDELCEVVGEATRKQRNKGQPRGSETGLDPTASQRRRDHGEAGEVRRPNVTGPARTTGGARLDLCSTRHRGCKLCDRSGLRVVRGSGAALIILVTSSFFLRSPLRPSAELSRPHRNAYAGSRRAGCLFPNKVSRRRLHCSAFTHWEIHRIFGIPETASMVPLDAPAHAALAGLPPAASAPTARSSSTNCAYAARLSASAGRRRREEG